MNEWSNFFIATAGAAAALTGLIFIGISINLTHILAFPLLVVKASVALVLLVAILICSIISLVPHDSFNLVDECLVIAGAITWIIVTRADLKVYKGALKKFKKAYLINLIFDQFATLPYILAGMSSVFFLKIGYYLMIPAIILSFIKAVFDAWVLLIEIKR